MTRQTDKATDALYNVVLHYTHRVYYLRSAVSRSAKPDEGRA